MCGEKTFAVWENVPGAGSPPRMRGKVTEEQLLSGKLRITPRVCGEKTSPVAFLLSMMGSPPPVRGKDVLDALRRAENGITPACAGKSPNGPQ